MRYLFIITLLYMTTTLSAQRAVEFPLWTEKAPNSNELTGAEEEAEPHRISNVTNPTITVYPSAKPESKTIIMCPGGGYARLAMDHEGHDMAPWFQAQNITYVVLKYRMPNGHADVPLSDAEQAIRLVRQRATEWNVDPRQVGIMGASAGGHLAATLATHYSNAESRPDFQILFYPVITMDERYTHQGSRANLLGKQPTAEQVTLFSNEQQVNAQTPPAFIMLSSDDKSVPAANGIQYYLALVQKGVSASLHAYPTGGHGWGFRDSFSYKRQWTGELEKWLRTAL